MEKKAIGDTKMGGGPIISIGPNLNPIVVKRLFETAKKLGIPSQRHAANRGTGTDANAIQLAGAATGLVGIPNRYMHTASEIIHLEDVKNIIKLMVEFIKDIKEEDSFLPL
ncbi:MAG: M42 family peptidase, partial [Candidatus Heimdallarchaeaceae archaeon]